MSNCLRMFVTESFILVVVFLPSALLKYKRLPTGYESLLKVVKDVLFFGRWNDPSFRGKEFFSALFYPFLFPVSPTSLPVICSLGHNTYLLSPEVVFRSPSVRSGPLLGPKHFSSKGICPTGIEDSSFNNLCVTQCACPF